MADVYTEIADAVAADLRSEGCSRSIAITTATRAAQPEWARAELAGRLYLKRDLINRLPGEDRNSYDQSVNIVIARSDAALGLIVARGPSAEAMVYRLMSYHTQLDDLLEDWPALLEEIVGMPAKDLTTARTLAGQLLQELA